MRPFAGRVQRLAASFVRGEYNFVPLVTEDLFSLCELDVLFVRQDPPGKIIDSGDIDGRLKTPEWCSWQGWEFRRTCVTDAP